MQNGLEDNDTAKPAVKQVVRIKREAQERDQWIVTASQDEERNL